MYKVERWPSTRSILLTSTQSNIQTLPRHLAIKAHSQPQSYNMHFSTVIVALAGASTTLATVIPELARRQSNLCSEGSAVCCATDVLGVADLNCAVREYLTLVALTLKLTHTAPSTPTDPDDFTSICATIGQQAKCCLLPIVSYMLLPSRAGLC